MSHTSSHWMVPVILALATGSLGAQKAARENSDAVSSQTVTLTTAASTATRQQTHLVAGDLSEAQSFLIEVAIDPTDNRDGDHQAIAGIAINLPDNATSALPSRDRQGICFELREAARVNFWDIWIDGINEGRREPSPRPPGWVDKQPCTEEVRQCFAYCYRSR